MPLRSALCTSPLTRPRGGWCPPGAACCTAPPPAPAAPSCPQSRRRWPGAPAQRLPPRGGSAGNGHARLWLCQSISKERGLRWNIGPEAADARPGQVRQQRAAVPALPRLLLLQPLQALPPRTSNWYPSFLIHCSFTSQLLPGWVSRMSCGSSFASGWSCSAMWGMLSIICQYTGSAGSRGKGRNAAC